MPHLTVHARETDLTGREPALIEALTDAVVDVYGEWAREIAVVLLIGVPEGRWGIGGKLAEAPAPRVTFGIRAAVFDRPDATDVLSRLTTTVTDAIASVLGAQMRPGVTVEFVGSPDGRTGVGGALVAH
ncbi:tautomerase family protein [Paractinoplanes globisporus]|uniref:Tautomerase family protein n=1 Tax=Paractinoplanes globisporus TaxID=113565 RepID=A0ABW6W514_9ACTN|nr:tautomerase family protein [Actinoplanes globisporus]